MFKSLVFSETIIHSLKTALATLIGLLITFKVGKPLDPWIIITILVVMCSQIYVGSVFQKAYFRFLGTVLGCLFASFILVTLGVNDTSLLISITLASFIFSYFAVTNNSFNLAGTLGVVTAVIILIAAHPSLMLAFHRFLEIGAGIFIAFIVSQFVLPIHARTHLNELQIKTVGLLKDYYIATMILNPKEAEKIDYREIDDNIIKSLTAQRQLAKESSTEWIGERFDINRFDAVIFCEKKILRAINFMHSAIVRMSQVETIFSQFNVLAFFNLKIELALQTLIEAMKKQDVNEALILPDIHIFEKPSKELNITFEELYCIEGFIFSTKIFLDNLTKLAALYGLKVKLVMS